MYIYSVEFPRGEIVEGTSISKILKCVRVHNGVEGHRAHFFQRDLRLHILPVYRLNTAHQIVGVAHIVKVYSCH